jgi:hypothetical protein
VVPKFYIKCPPYVLFYKINFKKINYGLSKIFNFKMYLWKKKIEILIYECIYNMFNQFMSSKDSMGNKVCIHMCNLLWNIFINLNYYVKKLRVQKHYVNIFDYIENLMHYNIMCTNYQTYLSPNHKIFNTMTIYNF